MERPKSQDEWQLVTSEIHRSIGRYIVEFSQLIYQMRRLVTRRLHSDPPVLAELALTGDTASQIRDSFFGMCRYLTELDKEMEVPVESRLRALVNDEIELRNYIAHGDWYVDLAKFAIVPVGTWQLVRVKPLRGEGAIEIKELTAKELDEITDHLVELRNLVTEYGMICLSMRAYRELRVSDVLVKRGNRVTREGRKAPATFGGF